MIISPSKSKRESDPLTMPRQYSFSIFLYYLSESLSYFFVLLPKPKSISSILKQIPLSLSVTAKSFPLLPTKVCQILLLTIFISLRNSLCGASLPLLEVFELWLYFTKPRQSSSARLLPKVNPKE